jgi:hypothetical protein
MHRAARQVFVICREALADSPSCGPALDTLAQYYASLAAAAAAAAAAQQGGGGAAGAAGAAAAAAQRGLAVLAAAAAADPMRANHWRHRGAQLRALLAQLPRGQT